VEGALHKRRLILHTLEYHLAFGVKEGDSRSGQIRSLDQCSDQPEIFLKIDRP
jgi:hypothetical protein